MTGEGEQKSGQVKVVLGGEEFVVVPQPHPLILRRLPQIVTGASELGTVAEANNTEALVTGLGDRVYDVLKIFIPDIGTKMPKYKFMGFATKEAMKANEEDDEAAKAAPTLPDIIDAFDKAFVVNGGKRLQDLLGKALGPEVSRAIRRVVVAELSKRLENLQPPSGESDKTSSGASGPTPPEPASEA